MIGANRGARLTIQGSESVYQGGNRGAHITILTIASKGDMWTEIAKAQGVETGREYAANYRKPPVTPAARRANPAIRGAGR